MRQVQVSASDVGMQQPDVRHHYHFVTGRIELVESPNTAQWLVKCLEWYQKLMEACLTIKYHRTWLPPVHQVRQVYDHAGDPWRSWLWGTAIRDKSARCGDHVCFGSFVPRFKDFTRSDLTPNAGVEIYLALDGQYGR